MKKNIMTVLAALLALSACGNINRETLGLDKKAPNEFMVSTKAPLTMPPEADLNPIRPAPSVQPKITLENVSKEEANFVSNFDEPSVITKIDEIDSAIDKELKRMKRNG